MIVSKNILKGGLMLEIHHIKVQYTFISKAVRNSYNPAWKSTSFWSPRGTS